MKKQKKTAFQVKKEKILKIAGEELGGSFTKQEIQESFNRVMIEKNREEAEKKKKPDLPTISKEEAKEHIVKSIEFVNLAFVLADVVDSVVMDAESELIKVARSFVKKDKQNFSNMKEAIKHARTTAKAASRSIYHMDEQSAVDNAIGHSDAIYGVIKAINAKCDGEDDNFRRIVDFINSLEDVPVEIDEEQINESVNALYTSK